LATPFIFYELMALAEIKNLIYQAELNHSGSSGRVKLIAVSKVQPNNRVEAVLEEGHRVFGENRVQEAQSKWPDFKSQYQDVELHIIGPLQTNKTRAAMELADSIHTLDRPKLAKNMARLAQSLGKCPELFVQVNTGNEQQKTGVSPKDTESFVKECLDMDLPVRGLMCIPPVHEEASLHFALLKKISENCGLKYLSMGMSSDFEKAISFGATHIRVGSAIFGERVRPSEQ
jgi:pyridoxal phosphate enzyme (YggS family)